MEIRENIPKWVIRSMKVWKIVSNSWTTLEYTQANESYTSALCQVLTDGAFVGECDFYSFLWIHSLGVEQTTEANGMKAAGSVPLCLRLLVDLFMKGHLSLYSKNVRLDRDKIDGLLQEDSQIARLVKAKQLYWENLSLIREGVLLLHIEFIHEKEMNIVESGKEEGQSSQIYIAWWFAELVRLCIRCCSLYVLPFSHFILACLLVFILF